MMKESEDDKKMKIQKINHLISESQDTDDTEESEDKKRFWSNDSSKEDDKKNTEELEDKGF